MLRNINAAAAVIAIETPEDISEGLRDIAHDFEQRFLMGQPYTPEQARGLLRRMRRMSSSAARLEGKSQAQPFVNVDAAKAVAVLHRAEQLLELQRRALIERTDQPRTDPTGRIRSGIAEAITQLELAGAIVAGVAEARS